MPLKTSALALALFVTPAQAMMVCGERADIVGALLQGHDEQPVADGLAGSGGVVELFLSPNGSWTLIMTLPQGKTCLLSSGTNWETFKPLKPAQES